MESLSTEWIKYKIFHTISQFLSLTFKMEDKFLGNIKVYFSDRLCWSVTLFPCPKCFKQF